jgi:hypothetical protein
MKSLKSIDLTNNIFNRTQLQMFGNNSIFPNLECITLKQLSLDNLGLNGRNCGVNKTTLIMKVALKGDCECGKRNDVDGPEVENLEIKQPAQKPPAKLPILNWILIIFGIIFCLVVIAVSVACGIDFMKSAKKKTMLLEDEERSDEISNSPCPQ